MDITGTSGTWIAGGNLSVNSILTTPANATLDMGTYTLAANGVTNNGTITTQNTSSAPLPAGKTWTPGTVRYNAGSGGQTVMAGTYGTLNTGGSSGTSTASGNLVAGALATAAGTTLDMATYTLNGVLNVSGNQGTIATQNTSAQPIGIGKTWGGTVVYNAGAGTQSVVFGTYSNLSVNTTEGATLAGTSTATVNGVLALGSKLNLGIATLVLGTSASISGASSGSYIIKNSSGTFRRLIGSNGSLLFPIGDISNYTPVTLAVAANSYSSAYVTATVNNVKHPANTSATHFLSRYWSIAASGVSSPSITVTGATYVPGDVHGLESRIRAAQRQAGVWTMYGPVGSNTITMPAIASSSFDITGVESIETNIAIGNVTICAGNTTTLTATPSAGDEPFTYQWYAPSGTQGTNTNQGVSPAGTTVYTVVVTGASTMTTQATATVTVNEAPAIVMLGNNGPVCDSSVLSLLSSVSGGTAPYIYSWTGPNGFSSTNEDPTVAAAGTYTLEITDANNCTATGANTTAVTIVPRPAITTLGSNTPVCEDNLLSLESTVTGGTTPYVYSWTGPDGFSSTEADPTVTATADADVAGTYLLSITDNNGCVATGANTTVVAVLSRPTITAIGNNAPVCAGDLLSLNSTVTGGSGIYTYLWTGPRGFSATNEDPVVTTEATTSEAGTYALAVMDGNNCIAIGTNTTTVTVHAAAPISGDNSVTFGQTMVLSNAVSGGTWSASAPWITNVNSTNGSVKGISAGTGLVSYINPNGCVTTQSVTVFSTVNACVGQTITLIPSGTGGTWASSNGSIATIGATTGVVTGVNPGKTTMIYRLPGGAMSTTTVIVNPLVQITSALPKICQGQVLTMTNTTGTGTWYSDDSAVATVSVAGAVTGLGAGTANIYFTPSTGCATLKTVTVSPAATISGVPVMCAGQTTMLSTSIPGGVWISNSAAVATVTASGVVSGVSANQGRITYSAPGGCISVMTITVHPLNATTGSTMCCQNQTIALTNTTAGGGVWSSNNTAAAMVNGMGVVSGTGSGSAVISFTTAQGCVAMKPVSVNGVDPITGVMTVCVGQKLQLSNSMPGGVWYASSGALATVTSAGSVYGVSAGAPRISYIMPSGCWTQVTVTVNALNSTTGGTGAICASNSITLTNTTPFGGVWSSTNTAAATVSASGFVKGTGAGITNILFTAANGCVFTRPLTVNACRMTSGEPSATIEDVAEAKYTMELFPNPNNGSFTLKGNLGTDVGEEITINIVNMLGQTMYSNTAKMEQGGVDQRIDLGNTLANGTYMLTLTAGAERQVHRFVVSR